MEIEDKIKELAKLIENKMAVTIYADNTWKQIGGEELRCNQNTTIKDLMNTNNKYALAEEIILLRKRLSKFLKGEEKEKKVVFLKNSDLVDVAKKMKQDALGEQDD